MTQDIKRTSTINMDQEHRQWGKLIALSKGISDTDLKSDSILIGRNTDCTIIINDRRLSGKHCHIQVKGQNIELTDLSTNGTFIKDTKIGKNKTVDLHHNDEFWLLPPMKVSPDETIGFKIQIYKEKQKLQKQEAQKSKISEKIQEEKVQPKKSKLSEALKDQLTCSFCFEIMFLPVTMTPCNHHLCGACLTDLVNNKKGQCIQCRKQIKTAARDATLNSIIQNYLQEHTDEIKSKQDQQAAKVKNIFGYDPTDIYALIHGKNKKAPKASTTVVAATSRRGRRATIVRGGSDLSAQQDEDDGRGRCRQCTVSRNGFQCSSTQVHVACLTCAKLIAKRTGPDIHQQCALCTQTFCNLYYPPCASGGVKLAFVKDKRSLVKIDKQVLRSNQVEFDGLRNFLLGKKLNSKDVFDWMMENQLSKDKFKYIIDRKVMKFTPIVSKQIPITPNTAVCDLCWTDLWFQIVLAYRTEINSQLPSSVKDRPICYWGVNCKTMDHNLDHAKKYNHMVFQSRF